MLGKNKIVGVEYIQDEEEYEIFKEGPNVPPVKNTLDQRGVEPTDIPTEMIMKKG